ncbi:MAG: tRNA epoxyqueuosine(34) reductase QueG [Planctomycetota bacterium]|nr:MAG: tRNA epoxyqueuosine(34) reductase QueG [Planctomycetota bacterium]
MLNAKNCQEIILSHGFHLVGFTRPEISEETSNHFLSWLENGYDADMAWIRKRTDERIFPEKYLDGIQTVIVIAKYYKNIKLSNEIKFSSYIRGQDYHDLFKKELKKISLELNKTYGEDYTFRGCVDTSPILERAFAQQAGVGWQGKNGMIINEKHGSYFFIGEIVTDIASDFYNTASPDRCGTCTRCLDACPTDAFVKPYVLDSNKCISYQTIEARGALGDNVELSDWAYGCDICQEVCPWNNENDLLQNMLYEGEHFTDNLSLAEILQLDEEGFRTKFKKSAIKRIKREGLIRNALIIWQENRSLVDANYVKRLFNDENKNIQFYARKALELDVGDN